MSLSGIFNKYLYSLDVMVSEFMTEFANWGLTGFRMGLSVMAAKKLANSCFMYCFCRVLCCRGGGGCGGSSPLYPQRCYRFQWACMDGRR